MDDDAADNLAETDGFAEVSSAAQDPHALADADTLAQLRELLVGPERRELDELRERLSSSRAGAQDIADHLPQAISLREQSDDELARALSTTVEGAIQTSVKNNPQPMIDAVFPVIGPAIRKAVSDALAKAVQSLNQTLEHSFSARSLKWRIEAARTGKPFAEVVLLNTLRYRVEQVFLIHRETGLLVQHAAVEGAPPRDGQLVSGMLTAISDFVRDSFGPDGQDQSESSTASAAEDPGRSNLRTMQVGGTTVWIERGPYAVLAGAVRGSAPAELREVFQQVIEDIHRHHNDELKAFSGDTDAWGAVQPDLERCLVSAQQPGAKRKISPALIIVGVIALGLIGWGVVAGVRSNAKWNSYIDRLKQLPGVMLVEEDHNWWGPSTVRGLYDPDAEVGPDDDSHFAASGVDPDEVVQHWVALPQPDVETKVVVVEPTPTEPTLLSQAIETLAPPPGVELRTEDNTLFAQGRATHAWIAQTLERLPSLGEAGMRAYDDAGLIDTDLQGLESSVKQIESLVVAMPVGADLDVASQREVFAELSRALETMESSADAMGYDVTLRVVGHADVTGDAAANQLLSEARAQVVADALRERFVSPPAMVVVGVGSSQPIVPESASAADQQRNRRVTFAVQLRGRED